MYAEDTRDMIVRIMQQAQESGEEVEVEEGFLLYKEMAEVRRVYTEAIPGYDLRPYFLERGNMFLTKGKNIGILFRLVLRSCFPNSSGVGFE